MGVAGGDGTQALVAAVRTPRTPAHEPLSARERFIAFSFSHISFFIFPDYIFASFIEIGMCFLLGWRY